MGGRGSFPSLAPPFPYSMAEGSAQRAIATPGLARLVIEEVNFVHLCGTLDIHSNGELHLGVAR